MQNVDICHDGPGHAKQFGKSTSTFLLVTFEKYRKNLVNNIKYSLLDFVFCSQLKNRFFLQKQKYEFWENEEHSYQFFINVTTLV